MPKRIKKTPCEKCPLYEKKAENFRPTVSFAEKPKWMVITEGSDGRGQDLFMDVYDRTGIHNGPIIAHVVKCHVGDEPPSKAISLCKEAYLDKDMERFKGKKVLLLGRVATHSLYKKKRALRDLIGMPLVEKGKQFLSVWNPSDFFKFGNTQILLDIERAIKWAIKK